MAEPIEKLKALLTPSGFPVNREGHPFLSSIPYCREGIHDSQFTD